MKRKAIIHRLPIKANDFQPINDPLLKGYTINMEGEVRDKAGHTPHRIFMPHLPGAIVMFPGVKEGHSSHPATFLCDQLVTSTFYPDALYDT